jgi:hypothetical protein
MFIPPWDGVAVLLYNMYAAADMSLKKFIASLTEDALFTAL